MYFSLWHSLYLAYLLYTFWSKSIRSRRMIKLSCTGYFSALFVTQFWWWSSQGHWFSQWSSINSRPRWSTNKWSLNELSIDLQSSSTKRGCCKYSSSLWQPKLMTPKQGKSYKTNLSWICLYPSLIFWIVWFDYCVCSGSGSRQSI